MIQESASFFNIIMLVLVVSAFAYFLYVQYNQNQQKVEEKRIPFQPTTWYSATRNVRSEEYGRQLKPFEIEARNVISWAPTGGSSNQIHGTDLNFTS